MMTKSVSLLAAGIFAVSLLTACEGRSVGQQPQDVFMGQLQALCGKAFSGRLVSTEDADSDFAREELVMHVRDCESDIVRIPLHVGENRSRTWVISRTDTGLQLKHDHRHEDGSEDTITQYGGDTTQQGTATRQEFPADAYSKELFLREGLDVSVDNIWALETDGETLFAYELRRPNRFFRVEFDLTAPAPMPPAAWGAETQ